MEDINKITKTIECLELLKISKISFLDNKKIDELINFQKQILAAGYKLK